MKSLLRLILSLLVMLATLLMSNCSPYGCRVTFGSSTCTPSGSGIGGGGGGGNGGGGGGGGGANATPTAFVYAVDQNGKVDGFDLSTSAGSFKLLSGFSAPTIPTSDPGVGMIVVNKKFVYAVFEGPTFDGIFGWSINASTGALTPLSGFPLAMSLALNRGLSFNQYSITADPAGKFLFLANSNLAQILVFSINSTTGALTAVPGSPFSIASDPLNLATDGLGRWLYVCQGNVPGHSGIDVVAFSIGSNGALTAVQATPFSFPMWQLQGDATGKYLVGTSGNTAFFSGTDDDHLYVFSINQSTGAISQTSSIATTHAPFSIAMQPPSSNGEFVYSFGINDTATGFNPIEGFQLNSSTGLLTQITGSPFSNVFLGTWGQFDQSGGNLLVYSSMLSNGVTVTQIGPLNVASDGSLTQPISAATLATPGYWVVTDP